MKTNILLAICWRYLRKEKKYTKYELLEKFTTYHDDIKITIEENQRTLPHTELVRPNSGITNKAYISSKNFSVHWTSKIPLRYKHNAITGESHRSNEIASHFNSELKRKKFIYL